MKSSRPDRDCFVLVFECSLDHVKLEREILKGKEKFQFQRVFLEIFGLLKPEVVRKMCIFAVIEEINIRCTFINTASCAEQHALYRIAST